VDTVCRQAIDWLLTRQDPAGWWCGELETNATMTAEHILLLCFLGLDAERERIREGVVRHILGCQRDDGSWSLYYEGPADLSTTIEAYAALKVLGVDPGSAMMQKALAVVVNNDDVAAPVSASCPRSSAATPPPTSRSRCSPAWVTRAISQWWPAATW